MTRLRELQRDVRAALLSSDEATVTGVREDGLGSAARLGIYRHHILATLTAALAATFPVVCRLVDERFFGYAADRYIRLEPPSGPCLFEYGGTFPAFLAEFPPCQSLPYLADVARLEWAMHRAVHAPDAAPLAADALRSVSPERVCNLVFSLDPSLSLLASPWPIHRIWRANQPASEDVTVDLRAGGATLEVRRLGDEVVFRALGPGPFSFRRTLGEGMSLGAATEQAVRADPGFDLSAVLAAVFQDAVVVGFTCHSATQESDPCQHEKVPLLAPPVAPRCQPPSSSTLDPPAARA
jgi:hypothetical protein